MPAIKEKTTKQGGKSVTRKAPGTRLGTWEDWRGGYNKPGKTPRHGHGIRDGR